MRAARANALLFLRRARVVFAEDYPRTLGRAAPFIFGSASRRAAASRRQLNRLVHDRANLRAVVSRRREKRRREAVGREKKGKRSRSETDHRRHRVSAIRDPLTTLISFRAARFLFSLSLQISARFTLQPSPADRDSRKIHAASRRSSSR